MPYPMAMPHCATDDADDDRLDQELKQDVEAAGADGEPQADFARPLGHRHQHDVHDPDAADDERDAGDTGEQAGHRLRGLRSGAPRCLPSVWTVKSSSAPLSPVRRAHRGGDDGRRRIERRRPTWPEA